MACMGTAVTPSQLLPKSSGGVAWQLMVPNPSSKPCKSACARRFSMCMSSLPVSPPMVSSTPAMPLVLADDSFLLYLRHPKVITPPLEVDEVVKMEELRERSRRELRASTNPVTRMNMIDMFQRLGIGYDLEDEINEVLEELSQDTPTEEDLYTTALWFRLLRHNGYLTTPDIFRKFMDETGKFKESLREDPTGLLSLYEASYLGASGEDILDEAKEFTTRHLKNSVSQMAPKLRRQVSQALELPRHLRMGRLEVRRFIQEYSMASDHNPTLLELAKLEYNQVQSLHQMELAEISRWWKHLGLVSKLSFARDRPLECFLWTVGLLPEPKYSGCRIELAKAIAILLVIDDIFDTYGSHDDLVLFTEAIRRWDLNEMEQLPEYMKICYMALYNTTNEICYKVLKEHGWRVLPFLRRTWMDMVEAFMVEADWVKNGIAPSVEDYIVNGATTAGSYMALVHLFFLIGEGVTDENARLVLDPYPKLFSSAGRILRLWDDLGTAKEEQERGDVSSSIHLFMRENGITCEEEGRKRILQLIHDSWKDLNGELIAPNALPLPIINVALNMSRASQVVYQHDEESYFSCVDKHVQSLFFTPVNA